MLHITNLIWAAFYSFTLLAKLLNKDKSVFKTFKSKT